jgi:hypothetical protein
MYEKLRGARTISRLDLALLRRPGFSFSSPVMPPSERSADTEVFRSWAMLVIALWAWRGRGEREKGREMERDGEREGGGKTGGEQW